MQKGMVVVGLVVTGLLAACATPTVVEVKQTGDAGLSCSQIKDELALADKYLKAAKKDRTVTGTNVAAAIFFLPGLLGTYVNTEEAINAAKEREVLLNKLAQKKKCNLNLETVESPSPVQTSDGNSAQSPQNAVSPAQTQASVEPRFRPMTTTEIQKQLLAFGYQAGIADGIMGKKSVDALKKFQQDNNLPITGQADSATMGKLRQKARYTSAK